MLWPNLKSPEITAIKILGGGANFQSRKSGDIGGRERYRSKERW